MLISAKTNKHISSLKRILSTKKDHKKSFLSKFQVLTQSRYWEQLVKLKREMPVIGNWRQKCHKAFQNDTPRTGSAPLRTKIVQRPGIESTRLLRVIITLNNGTF